MTVQTDFLDVFRGDTLELQVENDQGQIRNVQAQVVSVTHKEPQRIDGVPMKGYKSALLEVENDEGQAEIRWMHMTREVAEDKDINYGKYEMQTSEDFEGTPTVDDREKVKLGRIMGIEVLG